MQVRFSATNIEQVGVRYRYLQTFFVISFELRPSALFRNFLPFLSCYSECQRGIHSWMLRFTQHDKGENVIPSVSKESTHGCSASLSMTSDVIPSVSEESTHGCFASLSMTSDVIPSVSEESTHGCSASLSMTSDVIPSVSEESTHGCSASLSMTRAKMSFRTPVRNPVWMLHCTYAPFSMTALSYLL